MLTEKLVAWEILNTHGPDFGRYIKTQEDIIFAKKILKKIIHRPQITAQLMGIPKEEYDDFRLRAISEYGNFVSKDNSGEWMASDKLQMDYFLSLALKNLSSLEAYAVFGAFAATGSLQGSERLYSFFLKAQTKSLQATLMSFMIQSMSEHPVYELKRTKVNNTMIFSLPYAPYLIHSLSEREDRDQWKSLIAKIKKQLNRLKKETNQPSLMKLYVNYENFLENNLEKNVESAQRSPSSTNSEPGVKKIILGPHEDWKNKSKRELAAKNLPTTEQIKPSSYPLIGYFLLATILWIIFVYLFGQKRKK